MDVELVEIAEFLRSYRPFSLLPEEVVDSLPAKIRLSYARRGTQVIAPEAQAEHLYMVRTGAVETNAPDGQLLARISEGEYFCIQAMFRDGRALNRVTAIEDSLFYMLPFIDFQNLCQQFPQFDYFFAPHGAERLRDANVHGRGPMGQDQDLDLMSYQVSQLLTREPISAPLGCTIHEAAQVMSANRVSCLLICDGGRLCGILTDRDLRNRVVAAGRDLNQPVDSVMTPNPVTIQAGNLAFDALLTMTQRNIRHLPVLRGKNLVGVITNTNMVQKQTTSAVFLVGDIFKRTTFEGLAEVVSHVPQVLVHMVEAGATAHNVGHVITSITDAVTQRLLELGEEKFGPPPVPYVWMACGSQARQEQTSVGDQDNCMILDDAFDEGAHGQYFADLATFVCDGLNACGYYYCPGEVMAMTPKWRQPLETWKRYFSRWIDEPEPKALMLSSIFFDLRPIRGEKALHRELEALILEKARRNHLFLAHMVGNALTHRPPLGFFRNFVLDQVGGHGNRLDLKHSGVVPIIDLARVYALEVGEQAVNTIERLSAAEEGKVLSHAGAQDLLDAFEFISQTRLIHQAEQIRRGEKPDNFLSPEALSQFQRNHLKDGFAVVKTIQSAVAAAHNVN